MSVSRTPTGQFLVSSFSPCIIPSLAPGANTTINVTAINASTGAFDNSATATATEPDPDTPNNTDNTGNGGIVGASADISLVKTLNTAGPYVPGQTISYTLTVANAGPSTATNITVTDTPTNLTITGVGGACTSFSPCAIATLTAGANTAISVTATINSAAAFDNSATATATEPDPNTANNTDNTGNGGTADPAAVDLSVIKTASTPAVSLGGALTYTITVNNLGSGTATNVVVTDILPPNFMLTSITSAEMTCTGTTSVTCTMAVLAAGDGATITLQGVVSGEGTLQNVATVSSSEVDVVQSNNTSTISVAIVAPIPTLSEWMLILLALMLAVTGVVGVRGRP